MKFTKRLLSLLLSVAMIITTLTVTPFVIIAEDEGEEEGFDENVCYIEDVGYKTLEEAVAAAEKTPGATIKLTADISLANRLSISKDLTITDDGETRTIFLSNIDTTSDGGYGRGIQTKDCTFSIIGTSDEGINIVGHDPEGTVTAKGSALCFIRGTVNLTNVHFSNCENSYRSDGSSTSINGGAINMGYTGGVNLNLKDVTFNDCKTEGYYGKGTSASPKVNGKGDDIWVRKTQSGESKSTITIDGKVLADDIYFEELNPVVLADTVSDETYIGLQCPDYGTGKAVISGTSSVVTAMKDCFFFPGVSNYFLNDEGKIYEEIKDVCQIGTTKYTSLKAAVDAVNEKASTTAAAITLIDDCDVTERINFEAPVTIKDDGKAPRTIYAYNTSDSDSDSNPGRAFNKTNGTSKTVTFQGTSLGNLTIVGHNRSGKVFNYGPLFYVFFNTANDNVNIKLNKVIITECKNDVNGGAIYCGKNGTVDITSCKITNNTAQRGPAIYCVSDAARVNINGGSTATATGNTITGNKSTYHTAAGAIHSTGGQLYIKGRNDIYDNTVGGEECNIMLDDPKELNVIGTVYGRIGIHYPEMEKTGGIIGKSSNGSYKVSAFFADHAPLLVASLDPAFNIVWGNSSKYTIRLNAATDEAGSYSYKNPTITTLPGNGAKVLSVKVDNGYFNIDSTGLPTPSAIKYIDNDYAYNSVTTMPDASQKYKVATLIFDSKLTTAQAKTIIGAFKFVTAGQGTKQTVTVGLAENTDGVYVAGGTFYKSEDKLTWNQASSKVRNIGGALAVLPDRESEAMMVGAYGTGGWIGAKLSSNAWYWEKGLYGGTRLSANGTSAEGYNGAYVNWASTQPDGEGTVAYINSYSKWSSSVPTEEKEYYYVVEDTSTVSASHAMYTMKTENTLLTSMNLSFDGDISMYFYFAFDDNIKAKTDNYVKVIVGEGTDEIVKTATISEMSNIVDEEGNYGIKVNIPAKMMGARVYMYVCDSTDTPLRAFGNYDGEHPEKNYNPLYYANYMFEKNVDRYNDHYSKELINMVTAMLNYGAAAQVQFNYDTANLVNKGHEDESETMAKLPDDAVVVEPTGSDTFTYAQLVAGSQTIMEITYTGIGKTATVSFDGVPTTNFTFENGKISIPVSAQNLKSTCEITASTSKLKINANYVIGLILEGDADANAKKTADRLYKFGVAADEFFGVYKHNSNAQEAVLQTAYAFLSRELYSQYEQNNMTDYYTNKVPCGRRNLNSIPENLTEYKQGYFDCSSFVYNIYRNVFGETKTLEALFASGHRSVLNVMTNCISGKDYYNEETLVKTYYNDLKNADNAVWREVTADAKSRMQPGDLFCYFGRNGGHVLFWTGNGFIHSTGSDYDSSAGKDKFESNGSIHYVDQNDFTYLYLKKHYASRAVIVRPLKILHDSDVNDLSKARIQLSSMDFQILGRDTTTATDLYDGQYVNIGDTVKFTVKAANKIFPNNIASDKTINISVKLPSGYEVSQVTEGGVAKGDVVTWSNVTVKAGATFEPIITGTLSTGTVKDIFGAAKGTAKLADAGSDAYAISFESQSVEIENQMKDTVINKIKDLATQVGSLSYTTNGPTTVNAILHDATNKTVDIGANDSDVYKTYVKYWSDSCVQVNKSSAWSGQLVSNFIGGRRVLMTKFDGDFGYNNRPRYLEPANLKIGDVLFSYRKTNEYYDYYIYLGDDNMLQISHDKKITLQSADDICQKFYGRTVYAVMRPLK